MKKKETIKRNLINTIITYVLKISSLYLLCTIFISCENENYPYYIKSNDHGVLWVANAGDNTITCIDRLNDEEIGTFSVGSDPSRTAVDLDGNCWVGCRGDETVYYVSQDSIVRRYNGFNSARGVALDQEGNVWIANSGNNTIQKISLPDTIISGQVALTGVGSYFYGALIDGNNYLWILDRNASMMIKYDIAQFPDPNAYETIKMPSQEVYGFTIDTDNTVWVSGAGTPSLYKIDGNNAVISDTYQIPSELFGGFISGVTFDIYGKIWISNYHSDGVLCFDPDDKTFKNFPVNGTTPHGLGSSDLGYIYTINLGSNDISKIDARTGEFVKSYKVGSSPYTYSDLTGFIYRHVTLNSKK